MNTAAVLFWFVVFFVLGAVWYIADRAKGQLVYRWFYGLTHKEGLEPAEVRGFIFNRKTSPRFTVAALLSTVQVVIMGYLTHETLFTLFMVWLLGIPALMLGFILGPIFDRTWQKKEKVFSAIDRVESGETKLSVKPVVSAVGAAVGKVVDRGGDILSRYENPTETTAQPAATDPAVNPDVPPKPDDKPKPPDGREAIRRFVDGR